MSTSLNPRARTSSRRAHGLSDVLTDRGARLDGCVELVGRPRWPADDPKARPDRIRPREAPPRPGCATAPGARPKSIPVIPGLLAEIHLGSRDASPARHNPHELNPRELISRNELFTGKSPGSAGDHVGSSAAPLPVRCAPSPSAAPLLLVQRRVKRRSRGKGAQRTRARTGPRSSLCMESSPHSPLRSHRPRPSRRGCERTGGRRRPRRASGTRNGALGGSFRPASDRTIAKTAESCGNC